MDETGALVPPALAIDAPTTARVASIYDAHQRELFSLAMRACRDHAAAEDVVQEAFYRLLVEVEAGRSPRNVRAWLYRVVANLVVSGGRRATVANRQLGSLAQPDEVTGPEPAYLDHERHDDLELALGELGDDARVALLMAADGFSGMEIAEAIGRSANATRTLMCRSRLQLRHRLTALTST